jgi:ectoine hydroxylase-related dioxygenase (phytanoyl-CoA dioxygenase family)
MGHPSEAAPPVEVPGLPPIRTAVAPAKRDLGAFGLTRFQGAFDDREIAEAKARLFEQAAGEHAAGVAFHDAGATPETYLGGPNQRIWNLINKGEIFRKLVLNSVLHELIGHMLGAPVLLSSFTGNIANPGGVRMGLHTDGGFSPPGIPYPLVANGLIMLDDFTDENGATRVVPSSHLASFTPDDPPRRTVPAIGPAGTLMVFDGRLWHGTGANKSSGPRPALLAYFCRPFVRQQENLTVSVAPEVLDQCSPELLSLLGFKVWRTLGMVEGSFDGAINARPSSFVTKLKP